MPDAADSFEFRKLAEPRGDPALENFSCGDGEYDQAVNRMVAELHSWTGRAAQDQPTVMVMTDGAKTAGVGAYQERPLWPIAQPPPDDAYIWVIALSKDYRRKDLGVRLLKGLMEHIRDDWGRVPETWAYLAANPPSHEMFRREGFTYLPSAVEGHDSIRWRAEVPLDDDASAAPR
ncbi:MAG: GNAT family N-acetyltransferase [Solirubrobacteraceae bacterium]